MNLLVCPDCHTPLTTVNVCHSHTIIEAAPAEIGNWNYSKQNTVAYTAKSLPKEQVQRRKTDQPWYECPYCKAPIDVKNQGWGNPPSSSYDPTPIIDKLLPLSVLLEELL